MTTEEFNDLLTGVLEMEDGTGMRLALALRHVVNATGEAGGRALSDWCKARAEQDAVENS